MKPKVSIWMITYNHEKFIEKALNGILDQKVNFSYNIVIGDDCSSDNTVKLINAYAQKYPDLFKIRVNDKNLGIIPNLFKTLDECDGDYIALCEGDDYWSDSLKLQRQIDFLSSNLDFIASTENAFVLDDSGSMGVFGIKPTRTVTPLELIKSRQFVTASIVFRNKRISEKFPVDLPAADTPLFLILSRFGKIHYLNIISSVYRRGNQGVTSSFSNPSVKKKLLFYYKFLDKITDGKYTNELNRKVKSLNKGIVQKIKHIFYLCILKALNIPYEFFYDIENENILERVMLLLKHKKANRH